MRKITFMFVAGFLCLFISSPVAHAWQYTFETGTEGWIPETYYDSQGISSVEQSSLQAKEGSYSLKMNANLIGGHANYSKGEVNVGIETQNLLGIPITAWVYCPTGSRGDPTKPNGVQIFVKDSSWRAEYGNWRGITENVWFQVSLTPSTTQPPGGWMADGFDPTQIFMIGVKVATGTGSTATYTGPIYLDLVNIGTTPPAPPASDHTYDFNTPNEYLAQIPRWDVDPGWGADGWNSVYLEEPDPVGDPGNYALTADANFIYDPDPDTATRKGAVTILYIPPLHLANKDSSLIRAEVRFDPPIGLNDFVATIFAFDNQEDVWVEYRNNYQPLVNSSGWNVISFDLSDADQYDPATPGPMDLKRIGKIGIQLFSNVTYTGTIYIDNIIVGGVEITANYPQNNVGIITASGTQFMLSGQPFYFAGANAEYLFEKSDVVIEKVLDDAGSLGLTVVRTWAFGEGEDASFQPERGVWNLSAFEHLDRLIAYAGKKSLRLVLPLVDNWGHYGGMYKYMDWALAEHPESVPDYDDKGNFIDKVNKNDAYHDQFFVNSWCKQWYKDYVTYLLNRTNSITGVQYKNDPNIFSWEIFNEPRCKSDVSGKRIHDWLVEMSNYVESLDPNHMIGSGEEGTYIMTKAQADAFTWQDYPHNYWEYGVNYSDWGSNGVDFLSDHKSASTVVSWQATYEGTVLSETRAGAPNIDYCSFRTYIDYREFDLYRTDPVDQSLKWLEQHMNDALNVIGKPVIMEEFGIHTVGYIYWGGFGETKFHRTPAYTESDRVNIFTKYYNYIYHNNIAGSFFWNLGYDGMREFLFDDCESLQHSPSSTWAIDPSSDATAISVSTAYFTEGTSSFKCDYGYTEGEAYYDLPNLSEKWEVTSANPPETGAINMAKFMFDVYNPGGAVEYTSAIVWTGAGLTWHESQRQPLNSGWNTIMVDLSSETWRSAASGWEYSGEIADLDDVRKISMGLFGFSEAGSVYIDNIRIFEDDGFVIYYPDDPVSSVISDHASKMSAKTGAVPNNVPVLNWTGEPNYESDGLNPETGDNTTTFTYRIKYTDLDNEAPVTHRVYIDKNGDGDYADEGEINDMVGEGTTYSTGVIYSYSTTILYSSGSSDCKYYFRFSDGADYATGNITQGISAATAIDAPDVLVTEKRPAAVHYDFNGNIEGWTTEDWGYGNAILSWDGTNGNPTPGALSISPTAGSGYAKYYIKDYDVVDNQDVTSTPVYQARVWIPSGPSAVVIRLGVRSSADGWVLYQGPEFTPTPGVWNIVSWDMSLSVPAEVLADLDEWGLEVRYLDRSMWSGSIILDTITASLYPATDPEILEVYDFNGNIEGWTTEDWGYGNAILSWDGTNGNPTPGALSISPTAGSGYAKYYIKDYDVVDNQDVTSTPVYQARVWIPSGATGIILRLGVRSSADGWVLYQGPEFTPTPGVWNIVSWDMSLSVPAEVLADLDEWGLEVRYLDRSMWSGSIILDTITASLYQMIDIKILGVSAQPDPVGKYEKLELSVDLDAPAANPYNPDEISLEATFTSPSILERRIYGFYMEENGVGKWKIRFAPDEVGTWSYQVKITTYDGTDTSATYNFNSAESNRHGWLRVSNDDPHYLEYDDDTSFFGIGYDRPWYLDNEGVFQEMAEHGMNILHFWFAPWDTLLVEKGVPSWAESASYDSYDQGRAAEVDEIISYAEEYGVKLVFTIWPHDALRDFEYHKWKLDGSWANRPDKYPTPNNYINAFSELDSDPHAQKFFYDSLYKAYQEKLYRYIIARWGYSEAIGMWALVSEMFGTHSNSLNVIDYSSVASPDLLFGEDPFVYMHPTQADGNDYTDSWIAYINNYFKTNDPFSHPTTASQATDEYWPGGFSIVDVPQIHTYSDLYNKITPANTVAKYTRELRDRYAKPNFMGEIGTTEWKQLEPDYLRNTSFAGLASGAPLTPMMWTTPPFSDYGDPKMGPWLDTMSDQMYNLSKFVKDIDLAHSSLVPATVKAELPSEPSSVLVEGFEGGLGSWQKWGTGITSIELNTQHQTEGTACMRMNIDVPARQSINDYEASACVKNLALDWSAYYPDGVLRIDMYLPEFYDPTTNPDGFLSGINKDPRAQIGVVVERADGGLQWYDNGGEFITEGGMKKLTVGMGYALEFNLSLIGDSTEASKIREIWIKFGDVGILRGPVYVDNIRVGLNSFNAWGMRNNDFAFAWIQDRTPGEVVNNADFEISGLSDGTYNLEWWDTLEGWIISSSNANSSGGTLSAIIPDFTKDTVVKIRRIGYIGEVVHDVSVGGVSEYDWVVKGDTANIDVWVGNQGTASENFTLTLTDATDSTQIGSEPVNIPAGESVTVAFSWDTSAASLGHHTLTATAGVVAGEIDTADNVNTGKTKVLAEAPPWESCERLGRWAAILGSSDAISLEVSTDYVSEGTSSFKLTYSDPWRQQAMLGFDNVLEDWSNKDALIFDVYNPGNATEVAVAIRTGDNWVWHEATPKPITSGWNLDITIDLNSSDWKTEASGWQYVVPLADKDKIQQLYIIFFGYTTAGAVYIDNIRLSTPGVSSDRRMWRYNLGRTSEYPNGPATFPLSLQWTVDGHDYKSPVIANGTVYIPYVSDLRAYDADTGALKWSWTPPPQEPSSWVYEPAIGSNGLIYFATSYFVSGVGRYTKIYCLDANTGAFQWSYDAGQNLSHSSNPVVAYGNVYIGCYNGNVYALDVANGTLKWSYATGARVATSAAVAGNTVYVASVNRLYAFDAALGTVNWSVPMAGWTESSPAVSGNVVYLASNDGKVHAYDATTGAVIWEYNTGQWVNGYRSSPAVANNTVYIGAGDTINKIFALDAATGTLNWSYLATGKTLYASPCVSNGTVYMTSQDNKLYALDGSTGSLKWSYTFGGTYADTESSPAIYMGRVYVGGLSTGNTRKLHCFSE